MLVLHYLCKAASPPLSQPSFLFPFPLLPPADELFPVNHLQQVNGDGLVQMGYFNNITLQVRCRFLGTADCLGLCLSLFRPWRLVPVAHGLASPLPVCMRPDTHASRD